MRRLRSDEAERTDYIEKMRNAEVARLTRLLQDTRYELDAIREARRKERLGLIELALDLTKSADPGHWGIAELIRAEIDKPGHPDNMKACPCGGACGCKA